MKNLTPYTVEKLIKLSFRRYIRSIYNNFFHQTQKFYWTNRIGSNRLQWTCSPVEFRQKNGFDGKNYYKLTIYIFGKRISSAFQRYMGSNFSFWGKKIMDQNVKGGIRSLTGQNVKIVNIRQSKQLAITSELLN